MYGGAVNNIKESTQQMCHIYEQGLGDIHNIISQEYFP